MKNEKSVQILDGFVLKVLAMVFMTIDHIGIFLSQSPNTKEMGYVFRIIGRLAFPLYCFFLAEGMRYTRSREKYLLRIGAMYAAITLGETIIVYAMKLGYTANSLPPEPFSDLFFGMLALYLLLLPGWRKILAVLPVAVMGLSFGVDVYEKMNMMTITWFPYYLRFGYGLFGLMLIILFYFAPHFVKWLYAKRLDAMGMSMDVFVETREYRRLCNIVSILGLIISVVTFWAIGYIGSGSNYAPWDVYYMRLGSYALLAGIFIYFYNGKRGHNSLPFRIITYTYFPLHLIILFLIFG